MGESQIIYNTQPKPKKEPIKSQKQTNHLIIELMNWINYDKTDIWINHNQQNKTKNNQESNQT